MKTRALILLLTVTLSISSTQAQVKKPNINTSAALMTGHDVTNRTFSNITITNRTGSPVTSYGLFISSYDVNDCSLCFGGVTGGDNATGALVEPVLFSPDQAVPIGQNYLYNLIYNGLYGVSTQVGSPPCALPGCSWPGDNPSVRGWCLTINLMSPNTSYTSSSYANGTYPPANVIPFGAAGNSNPFNYKYDLIDPATLGIGNACLGPIVCNDQSLTCSVSTAQNESFQPY